MDVLFEKLENGETVEISVNRLAALQNEMDVNYRRCCVDISVNNKVAKVKPVGPSTWLKKNI